jgi:hypothetical protein
MSELINQSINQSNTRYYWMVVVTPLPPWPFLGTPCTFNGQDVASSWNETPWTQVAVTCW